MPIKDLIIDALQTELDNAIAASNRAHATATDKENIPENKYDTLALEAAYLAHGQSKRIEQLQAALLCYQQFKPAKASTTGSIGLGWLVCIENEAAETKWLYLGPEAGGLKFEYQSREVQLVTPQTPMGKALLGLSLDDSFSLNIQGNTQEYWIIKTDQLVS